MLFFWLTICNKKGTVRDLCTIPLSSIIYYTTMKKISTTTYYHPILWHRIRCIFFHRHSPYMLPDLPRRPALLLRHGVLNRPVPEYSCNFHRIQIHALQLYPLHRHQFLNLFRIYCKHYDTHTVAHHMQPLPPLSHSVPLPCAEWYLSLIHISEPTRPY